MLKVPVDLAKVLSTMWGSPIPPTVIAKWAQGKHTPRRQLLLRTSLSKKGIYLFLLLTDSAHRSMLKEYPTKTWGK
jgi:hypothetical protein